MVDDKFMHDFILDSYWSCGAPSMSVNGLCIIYATSLKHVFWGSKYGLALIFCNN